MLISRFLFVKIFHIMAQFFHAKHILLRIFVILVTFHYFTESHTEICSELYHNKYNILYYIIMEILPRHKDV